jgi:hypothetical protein
MKKIKFYSEEEIVRLERIRLLLENYNRALLRGERFTSPLVSYEDRIACSEYFDALKAQEVVQH